ncbi:MAG: YciI family protein [Anaerolineae bacterium]|nr:YciI family protein [Anaerolineae bacterium]
MQYMCLIYGNEANQTPEQIQAEMAAYNAFTAMVRDRGAFVSAEALHPTNAATTVRVRDGKRVTTDGPFAETKEQLGGFYIVNCKDLDEAIELASHIPGAASGSIEIRPVVDFSAMPQ